MDHTRSSGRHSRGSNWSRAVASILIGGGLSISLVGAACRSSATGPGTSFAAEPLGAVGKGVAAAVSVLALAGICVGVLPLQLTTRLARWAVGDA